MTTLAPAQPRAFLDSVRANSTRTPVPVAQRDRRAPVERAPLGLGVVPNGAQPREERGVWGRVEAPAPEARLAPLVKQAARRPCRGYIVASGPAGERVVRPAHGGRRSCTEEPCRARYARRVFAIALAGVREATDHGVRFVKLVTFTLPARIDVDGISIEPLGPASYRYMARRFNRMMVSVRRRWRFDYFRVVEEQRRGAPHYHLLVVTRAFLPHAELVALATRAGLGKFVNVLAVRSHKAAARYVTKYVTKDAGAVVPARFRFFTRSRLFGAEARADAYADQAMRRVGWSYAYLQERDAGETLPALRSIGYLIDDSGPDRTVRDASP